MESKINNVSRETNKKERYMITTIKMDNEKFMIIFITSYEYKIDNITKFIVNHQKSYNYKLIDMYYGIIDKNYLQCYVIKLIKK